MNPAYSVILFTTASGAGYGLLVWISLAIVMGVIAPSDNLGLSALVLALALITVGLLSSTLHLGRPERAWRAISQWRTSWLSLEGLLALATYVPAGLLVLWAWAEPGTWWALSALLALAAAAGALATVWSTGMIYQSLPTIRAWSQPLVAPVYVLLALATGAVLMAMLIKLTGGSGARTGTLAAALLVASAAAKWFYWRRIDTMPRTWTAGAATGLGAGGAVRPLDPPHTQPNFVMREMGYKVARRHAEKLRYLAIGAGFLAPAALLSVSGGIGGAIGVLGTITALLGVAVGILTERWLFFAEAEHVVSLYYGADRV